MHEKHNNNMTRRIIDVCMTILLLFWAFTGAQFSLLCMRQGKKEDEKKGK